MTIRLLLVLSYCWIGIPWASYAQENTDFYQKKYQSKNELGLRAGVNYSLSTVTNYYGNNSTPTTVLWGVRPKAGFYVGSTYSRDLATDRILFRFDATLQTRGAGSIDLSGKSVINARYYYLGLSPQIGLHITPKLTLTTGLETNLLVAKQMAWGSGSPFELGTVLRATYAFGPFKAELGYVRAFNRYDQLVGSALYGGPFIFDFYNQNWQVGLLYNWHP